MKHMVLHIDRLVLKGFRHEDRQAIAEGVREELALLLAQPEIARQWAAAENQARLKVGGVRIEEGTQPGAVGTQVGQGISREIGS